MGKRDQYHHPGCSTKAASAPKDVTWARNSVVKEMRKRASIRLGDQQEIPYSLRLLQGLSPQPKYSLSLVSIKNQILKISNPRKAYKSCQDTLSERFTVLPHNGNNNNGPSCELLRSIFTTLWVGYYYYHYYHYYYCCYCYYYYYYHYFTEEKTKLLVQDPIDWKSNLSILTQHCLQNLYSMTFLQTVVPSFNTGGNLQPPYFFPVTIATIVLFWFIFAV